MLPYAAYANQSYQQNPSTSPSVSMPLGLNFDRLRYGFAPQNQTPQGPAAPTGYHFQHPFDPIALAGFRHAFDPRTGRFMPSEEPKPQHSYIGLIAMAILSSTDKRMVLSDIYQWILDHYPYFRTRGPGWRNSIRHNLSLNDCFIKSGRSANGKGHYWAIHPANVEDFKKGDFRRRRAQRKVRRHMGLAVADDEEDTDDSPCSSPHVNGNNFYLNGALPAPPTLAALPAIPGPSVGQKSPSLIPFTGISPKIQNMISPKMTPLITEIPSNDEEEKNDKKEEGQSSVKRRRLFDMESLLSPTNSDEKRTTSDPTENRNTSTSMEGAAVSLRPLLGPYRQVNPFFFPPPLPQPGPGNENGHLIAAMAAAAAGFMPFPFGPHWTHASTPFLSNHNIGQYLPMGGYQPWQNGTTTTSNSPKEEIGLEGENGDRKRPFENTTRTPSPQDTAAQWQETFAKIMARSYQGRQMIRGSGGGNKGHGQTGDEEVEEPGYSQEKVDD